MTEEAETTIEDGDKIAYNEHEFTLESIVVMDGQAYYRNENGGSRGAYQSGKVMEPTRTIGRDEARCLMLDWGYDPADVAAITKQLND